MTVRVRMYDVGFGDCFLVLGGEERPWRMLVDCGSHISSKARHGGSISSVARSVIDDCRDPDGVARIDVVVATHRHYDHIAGFDLQDWHAVEVGQVWLPWTEDPADSEARRIREAQARLAARLMALASSGGRRLAAARELLELVPLSNSDAMAVLHSGFSGQPERRFLAGDVDAAPIEVGAIPGLRAHVLGPARDEATIRDLDPPAGQSYLDLPGRPDGGEVPLQPFRELAWATLPRPAHDPALRELEQALGDDVFDLAASLQTAVNGTSLVLLLEIGRARLLFCGDAQWGTWRRILAHGPWRELLSHTTFLKVGHHGSHNATPADLVEQVLPDGIAAMVSVRPVARWPEIPRGPLLERLRAKSMAVVRSDQGGGAEVPGLREGPGGLWREMEIAT
jgi:beta-lactamase superfamily II metal-dependent hydrolase